MSKDLWFRIQIDDKKIDDLEKKVEKSMEKASSKGFTKGSSKAAGGSGGRMAGGQNMAGSVFQGMMRSNVMQTAISSGGQAFGDIIAAARGRKLRVEAEAATLKAGAAIGGAALGVFSSTGGRLLTEGGAAAVEQIYDRSLTTGRGAQADVEGYLKKLMQQGVSVSKEDAQRLAKRALAFQEKSYEVSKQATRAVNAVQKSEVTEAMQNAQARLELLKEALNQKMNYSIAGRLASVFGMTEAIQ